MNRSILFCFVFLFAVGAITFSVKQQVLQLEAKITDAKKEIAQYDEALHILSAEWAYLNNPERLQTLVDRNLDLIPGDHFQFVSFDCIGTEPELALPGSKMVHLASAH
jgi:cell division protein FtsL